MTIGGFDPSNGAGITADVKTIESLKCYGLSVCTANTIQDDQNFHSCNWIDETLILSQLEILLKRFHIGFVKIGIIESVTLLHQLIELLKSNNPEVKIVLDPIVKSSTGFTFQTDVEAKTWDGILDAIYMITPNLNEIEWLYPNLSVQETIAHLCKKTNVYLKGGHAENEKGKDKLYIKNGNEFTLLPKATNCFEKHGSGCVLSSAITCYLAKGFPLLKACFRGKRYVEKYLSSNKELLGFHG